MGDASDGTGEDLSGDRGETLGGPDGADEHVGELGPDATDASPVIRGSTCGNGVLDDHEECDDGNRVDGDGCDWLCRLGEGESPPAADPLVGPFAPAGPVVPLDGTDPSMPGPFERLPLVWTGEAFATALSEMLPGDEWQIRFRRFDASGHAFDADWIYDSPISTSLDLVWTGSGFGLFYSDLSAGIFYMPLDVAGKPLAAPRLVVPDPQARAPSADATAAGFVLAWMVEGTPGHATSWCGTLGEPPDAVRVRLVGPGGATDDLPGPVTVETQAGWPPDIATGEDGYGMVLARDATVTAATPPTELN
ncbi:MAG: hypothetical protein HY907_07975 [Deltaproteobacteria bacterium]|nr:hypothetical protein [Deltaproteobacteria bacterium]